jgi:hypothetical protein
MSTYDYKPGLGLVGAYQVSGIPFVSGPIFNAPTGGGIRVINFPAVTKFLTLTNTHDDGDLICGFSELGLSELTNAFVIPPTSSMTFELKVTQLYYTGSCEEFGIVAGLTYIDTERINNPAVSPSGSNTNWSGSLIAHVG